MKKLGTRDISLINDSSESIKSIFVLNCYRNRERLRCNGILIISKA